MRIPGVVFLLAVLSPFFSLGAQTNTQSPLPLPTEEQMKAAAAMPFRNSRFAYREACG